MTVIQPLTVIYLFIIYNIVFSDDLYESDDVTDICRAFKEFKRA